jgi:hypothetical protein
VQDGPSPPLAAASTSCVAPVPVPSRVCLPENLGLARASRRARRRATHEWSPAWTPTTSACRPLRAAAAAIEAGANLVGSALLEIGEPRARRSAPHPADSPASSPAPPAARPLQPPDRGLPALGVRPRAATSAAADGGLLAVRPHDRRGADREHARAWSVPRGAGAYSGAAAALLRAELVLQWRRCGPASHPRSTSQRRVRGLYRLVPGQCGARLTGCWWHRGERLDAASAGTGALAWGAAAARARRTSRPQELRVQHDLVVVGSGFFG